MSGEYKKTYRYLNYIKHLFILASAVTGCVSVSAFTSLFPLPIGITSSAVGIKIFVITAEIKKYKSIMKKKKKNHDKLVLLGKDTLNAIEVWTSKALIYSYISYKELISVNNVLTENNEMKEELKNPEFSVENTLYGFTLYGLNKWYRNNDG